MSRITIGLLIGSIRQARQSQKAAEALLPLLKEVADVRMIDLQELQLPIFDDGLQHKGKEALLRVYKEIDGLILVTPEYNHALPGVVKNAIDYAREKELMHKPVAIVAASAGRWGGARAAEAAHIPLAGVGMIVLPDKLLTPDIHSFDAHHPPEWWLEAAKKFISTNIPLMEALRKHV